MRFSSRKFGIENALNRDRLLTLPPTRNVTAINGNDTYYEYDTMQGGGRAPLTVLGFGVLTGIYCGIRLRKDKQGGYSFFYKSPYR